jgi:hypothetical protein
MNFDFLLRYVGAGEEPGDSNRGTGCSAKKPAFAGEDEYRFYLSNFIKPDPAVQRRPGGRPLACSAGFQPAWGGVWRLPLPLPLANTVGKKSPSHAPICQRRALQAGAPGPTPRSRPL